MEDRNNTPFSAVNFLQYQALNSRFLDMMRILDVQPRDYGDGNLLSKTDVLMLLEIERTPGITATELCCIFALGKGTVSQILSRMEKCGYVMRATKQSNRKTKHLFITADGKRVCDKRAAVRMEQYAMTHQTLCERSTPEEITAFYKVLGLYAEILEHGIELRRQAARNDSPDE